MKCGIMLMTVICSLNIYGQSYRLEIAEEKYENLENSISLNGNWNWDDPQYSIPLSFEFEYFSNKFTELYIDNVGFGGVISTDSSMSSTRSLLVVNGLDLIDRGYDFNADTNTMRTFSPISYKEDGGVGERILKVEWNNVGYYSDLAEDLVSQDFTNFQLWLYEGTNMIEIRTGPTNVDHPDVSYDGLSGPIIGLMNNYDGLLDTAYGEALFLKGNPEAPTLVDAQTLGVGETLDGTIPNRTVYRFIKNSTSTTREYVSNSSIQVFPNPTEGIMNIVLSEGIDIERITVNSVTGTKDKEEKWSERVLDLSDYPSGTYLVKFYLEKDIIVKRVTVK